MERLKKVKILQNGEEIDAYINIAEDIKAKAYGETREAVNMTVYAEFFNENHETSTMMITVDNDGDVPDEKNYRLECN